jgi:hypothetical protein
VRVLDFREMAPLACLMHWYISMLYVVPVVAVGGWGWWTSKRSARRRASRLSASATATSELTRSERPSLPV